MPELRLLHHHGLPIPSCTLGTGLHRLLSARVHSRRSETTCPAPAYAETVCQSDARICAPVRATAREPADDGGAELRAGVLVYAQATCASSASSAPSKADAAACCPVAAATPGVEVSVTVSLG